MKSAVISIDVEDWYHLEYFKDNLNDTSQSILEEGVNNFMDILSKENIKATFFVVGELISQNLELLKKIRRQGHEISGHSFCHVRPLNQSVEEFKHDSTKLLMELKEYLRIINPGYRAPCFSLDDERLKVLKDLNFSYDSSKISAGFHPLYGTINIEEYKKIYDNVYIENSFTEFELPTQRYWNKEIPISGGGYLRILPWFLFKYLLKRYLRENETYFFFIHPFELTKKQISLAKDASITSRLRFMIGRSKGASRLIKVIKILKEEGFHFVTFAEFHKELNHLKKMPLNKFE
jgi:polysaccharide deacetylase family protein (PEP-CTERM system associated)